MPEREIDRQPRLDASVAAGLAIGCAPRIAEHRDALVGIFGAGAGKLVDDLRAAALATKQADVEHGAAPPEDLRALHAPLRESHALLLGDADALVNRKLLDPARVALGRSPQGYRTLIDSTLVLVSVLREQWPAISHRTPLTCRDLDDADTRANRLLTALTQREQGTASAPTAEMRLRALSALVRHYGEIRRMVLYLRYHEGDADDIAPSLYVRRPTRRAPAEAQAEAANDEPVASPRVA